MSIFQVATAKVKYDDALQRAVRRSVELLGGMSAFVSPGDRVVIKPNMFLKFSPDSGKITHPAVVVELARMARKAGAGQIVVAERNFAHRFHFTDYKEVYELAEVFDLDHAPYRLVSIAGARNLQNPVPIPRIIDEADVFISCPGLRTHALSIFSNGIKNVMGILPQANPLHVHGYGLEESYLDLHRHRPTDLVVVDAFIAAEGNFPSEGDPRKLNHVFAATNPLAADLVACYLLGLEPRQIPFLAEAMDRGMGPLSLEEIAILGDPLTRPKPPVRPAPTGLSCFSQDLLIVAEGDCYGCRGALAGGLTAVQNVAPSLFDSACRQARIIIGPEPRVEDSPFNLFYGTCANRVRKELPGRGHGVYISGCPPLAGFVRAGLATVTRRIHDFRFVGEMEVRTVDNLLKHGTGTGEHYVAPTASDPRSAWEEIRRLFRAAREFGEQDWQIIVLSRNGLARERGLRFLERITAEAVVAGEEHERDWRTRFLAGLDLAELIKKEGMRAEQAALLVRRMAHVCGATVIPDALDDSILCALIEEHYGGVALCSINPDEVRTAYEGLYGDFTRQLNL